MSPNFRIKFLRNLGVAAVAALLSSGLVATTPALAADCTISGPNTFTSGSTTYSVVAIKSGTACTWSVPAGVTSLDILAVGGGGGGSSRHGGGGSAGKFVESTTAPVSSGATLTISIGAGGAGGRASVGGDPGGNGTSTTIQGSGLTTINATGGTGGSYAGGGTSGNGFTAGAGSGNLTCLGDTSGWCGGGGAGSTANGQSADASNNNRAGNGGAGSSATIYDSTIASSLSIPTAFAGGGGGGADRGATAGTASFGGGAGSAGIVNASSAAPNTGGGGGGSGYENTGGQGEAGAGASGIVVIRWALPYGSAKFNGTSQYLTVPSSADFSLGTGDFTIEWFQYQTSTSTWPRIFAIGNYPSTDIGVSIEGGTFYFWMEGRIAASFYLGETSNYFHKWVHFAITRSNGTLNIFNDGTRVVSIADATNQTSAAGLAIGSENGNSGTFFPGYLTNFHWVKGTALYSGSSLTRPTSPIIATSNTELLLNHASSAAFLTDTSSSIKTVTNVSAATWDANNPFSTTVPNAPTLNSATATSGGASLSVSIPSYNGGSPITSYEYQLDSGSWVSTGNTNLPITLTGLSAGQTYSVKVRAVNSVGAGAESSSATFAPLKATQTVTWSPSTTSATVLSGSLTVSGAASTNGDGALTYAVTSQGTTGCAYDSATRILTYTASGSCVVRATAASTTTYNVGTRDVTFTISRSTQTVTWSPDTSVASDESPKAVSVQATALGSATITYSVASQGTTGCSVNSSNGTITFSAVGTCTVRATAAQTTAYNTAYTDVAFVISAPTTYTITYSYQSADGSNSNPDDVFTVGGSALTLPTPTRTSYVLDGWYTAATGGSKIGNGGASYSPTSTRIIYARWVQKSLWNMGSATKIGTITTVSGVGNTYSANSSGTSVSLTYQADALPASTVIDVYLLADTARASQLITSTNSFVVNLVVAWKAADGTVPSTASGKPISMTISNPAIKRGQRIYALLGDVVTDLGVATADGTATFEITDDPEIVIANTKPDAPTSVTGVAAASKVTVSWSTPASNGGTTITGYTVTASNGATCTTTTTSCEITGLTNGTSYTFTVTATNSVGTSNASASSGSVIPAAASAGGGGGGTTLPIKPPTRPAPTVITVKPNISQGATALIGGVEHEVKIEAKKSASEIVANIEETEFKVKLVASTGIANLPQGLALTGIQGDDLKFSGGGLAPLSDVEVYVFSTPTFLGIVQTDSTGAFTGSFLLPQTLAAGQHTLQFSGVLTDGSPIKTAFVLLVNAKAKVKKVVSYFAAGSSTLGLVARAALLKVAKPLRTTKGLTVQITGFTQKTGFSARDAVLAKARAKSVAKYLQSLGFKKVNLSAKAALPATDLGSKARRAETVFTAVS